MIRSCQVCMRHLIIVFESVLTLWICIGFGWMKQMPPIDYAQCEQQMAGVYYS